MLPDFSELQIISISAVIAIVLVALRYVTLLRAFPPNKRMGSAEWDFSSSWATTLTTVGAILGTILSAEVLAGDKSLTFVSLNLLFGVIVVVAGLVYSAFRTLELVDSETDEDEKQIQGYVGFFVIACVLTLWAVVGELLTILALLHAIDDANALSSLVLTLFAAFIWLALVCALIYTWQAMRSTLEALTISRNALQLQLFTATQDWDIVTIEPPADEALEQGRRQERRRLRLEPRKKDNPPLPRWSVL